MSESKKNVETPVKVEVSAKVLSPAEQIAAAKAAKEQADKVYADLVASLGFTATKDEVIALVTKANNLEDLKVALFTALREQFPEVCKSFTAIQAQFPDVTFLAPKVKRERKSTSGEGKSTSGKIADSVYPRIDAAGIAGISKKEICGTDLNINTVGRILSPTELRAGYTHKDGKYFAPVPPVETK